MCDRRSDGLSGFIINRRIFSSCARRSSSCCHRVYVTGTLKTEKKTTKCGQIGSFKTSGPIEPRKFKQGWAFRLFSGALVSCWELTWKRLWLPRSEILNEVSSTTSHSPAPILIVGGVIGYCKIAEVVQYLRLRALLPHPSHIYWLKKIWQEFDKNCGVHFPRWQIGDVMMWRPGLSARQPAGISFSARPRVQYASSAIANSLFPKKPLFST